MAQASEATNLTQIFIRARESVIYVIIIDCVRVKVSNGKSQTFGNWASAAYITRTDCTKRQPCRPTFREGKF